MFANGLAMISSENKVLKYKVSNEVKKEIQNLI